MDVAASEFYRDGKYDLDFKNPNTDKKSWINSDTLTNVYADMVNQYPIVSIEDPFDQDHWDAWVNLTNLTNIQVFYIQSILLKEK